MISRTIAASIVALASLGGMATGIPTVWSPLNVLGLVPALLVSDILGAAALALPVIIFGGAFAWWCPSVWRGQARVPRRSLVLAVIALLMSGANILFGREYGLEYQGASYVRWVTVISVACWLLLGVLVAAAVRTPSVRRNLWFHVALFSWLGWYAVPYMGELP
jgi:hypothetical protein